MKTSEKLKILAIKLNISISEMARKCGKSPQAFSQKMRRESFTPDDLSEIAKKLGCEYEHYFTLNGGDKV
jgi:transcriptional regulator with XRE-family HTH domain